MTAGHPRPTRMHISVWIALLVAIVGIAFLRWDDFQFGWWGDDVDYYMLARSFATGESYGMHLAPTGPVRSQFPFGLPLLLSPFVYLTPGNVSVLRIVPLLATLVVVSLIFWGWPLISRLPYEYGLAVAALIGLAPESMKSFLFIMSEAPFTAFLLGALLMTEALANRLRNPEIPLRSADYAYAGILGVLLLFTMFTRIIGFLAVPCVFAYLLYHGRQRAVRPLGIAGLTFVAALGLVIAATSLTWLDLLPEKYLNMMRKDHAKVAREYAAPTVREDARNSDPNSGNGMGVPLLTDLFHAPSAGQYPIFLELAKTLERHVEYDVPETVTTVKGGDLARVGQRLGVPMLPALLGLGMSIAMAWGWFRWMQRDGANVFSLFGLLYLAVLTLWLWRSPRLLYPVQPMLFLSLLFAVKGLLPEKMVRVKGLRGDTIAIFFVALLAGFFVIRGLKTDGTRLHWGDITVRTRWTKGNLPTNAVLFTRFPRIDLFYGQRSTVGFPEEPGQELRVLLREAGITHVLIAPDEVWSSPYSPSYDDRTLAIRAALLPLLREGTLFPVYQSEKEGVFVYAIHPPPLPSRTVQKR